MNVLIAALLVASLAEPVPAKRVDQVVVSNPETTNVHVEVMCDYPVYQTVDDVSTNVFREALSDGTYVWKTNVWRTSKQIVTGYTPRVQVTSFSAAPGHSVFTNANSQLDIVEGMRVFADAGPAKVTLAYAFVAKADKTEGMTDNALVLTNGAVKTANGLKTIGAADVGALSTNGGFVAGNITIKDNTAIKFKTYKPDFDAEIRLGDAHSAMVLDALSYFYLNTKTDTGSEGIFFNGQRVALENWQSLSKMLDSANASNLAINPTFSDAVLAVGLNIDTNSVAVLNEIAETFGGFPLEGTATTVGGLLAALAAAVAWLKKNKVGSFDSVGGATAAVDNGVAKLDDFFTNSNSLLTATIESKVNSMFDNGDTTSYPRPTEG